MKNVLICIIFLIGFGSPAIGQNSYGISIGTGKGMILKEALDGDAGYDVNLGISIGLQFNRKLSEKFSFSTGLTWYNSSISVTPNYPPDNATTTYDIQMLYIPLYLQIDLSKNIFLDGGLLGDIDITRDKYITNQSGMGVGLGIGAQFKIADKVTLQFNPYLNFHGLLLWENEMYPEHVLDSGIKLRLMFN